MNGCILLLLLLISLSHSEDPSKKLLQVEYDQQLDIIKHNNKTYTPFKSDFSVSNFNITNPTKSYEEKEECGEELVRGATMYLFILISAGKKYLFKYLFKI